MPDYTQLQVLNYSGYRFCGKLFLNGIFNVYIGNHYYTTNQKTHSLHKVSEIFCLHIPPIKVLEMVKQLFPKYAHFIFPLWNINQESELNNLTLYINVLVTLSSCVKYIIRVLESSVTTILSKFLVGTKCVFVKKIIKIFRFQLNLPISMYRAPVVSLHLQVQLCVTTLLW